MLEAILQQQVDATLLVLSFLLRASAPRIHINYLHRDTIKHTRLCVCSVQEHWEGFEPLHQLHFSDSDI